MMADVVMEPKVGCCVPVFTLARSIELICRYLSKTEGEYCYQILLVPTIRTYIHIQKSADSVNINE